MLPINRSMERVEEPLVSIIIPTYNRCDYIGETLDSILKQTYNDWECIIIDDGSSDRTDELIEFYGEKDPRFKYFKRPSNRKKGGNTCRNIGFDASKGKYIQWFDSDDIMLKECLKVKMESIQSGGYDFVVAMLENFSSQEKVDQPDYNRENEKIKLEDFLFRRINWITADALISREILEKFKIQYNEEMFSDQEYNYYCKLLSHTENGQYINKILARRRIHPTSIQSNIDRSRSIYFHDLFKNRYLTFLDIELWLREDLIKEYLNQMMTIYFTAVGKKEIPDRKKIFSIVVKYKGAIALAYFQLSLISNYFLSKGYFLLQKAKNQ